jgi:hypothetical protein
MTRNLIDRLEQILPGIQNSNSQAEVAMVEVLPEVIASLKAITGAADQAKRTLQILIDPVNKGSGIDNMAAWASCVATEARLRKALEASQ